MPQTVTRLSGSQESPDSGQGGTAFDSVGQGGGSTSISISTGSQLDTARWFNFSGVPTEVARILLKFDWSIGGSLNVDVSENGTASADYSFTVETVNRSDSIAVNGPGPVSDSRTISDGGSETIEISKATPIGSIEVQANLIANASSTVSGVASAAPSCSISNIRLEITLADGTIQIMM